MWTHKLSFPGKKNDPHPISEIVGNPSPNSPHWYRHHCFLHWSCSVDLSFVNQGGSSTSVLERDWGQGFPKGGQSRENWLVIRSNMQFLTRATYIITKIFIADVHLHLSKISLGESNGRSHLTGGCPLRPLEPCCEQVSADADGPAGPSRCTHIKQVS